MAGDIVGFFFLDWDFGSSRACGRSLGCILLIPWGCTLVSFSPSFWVTYFVGLYFYCFLRAMGGPCCVYGG